jgi:hypothetical protein
MQRLAGAGLMVVGAYLLIGGITHFNSPSAFVSDTVLTPGEYYLGHTRSADCSNTEPSPGKPVIAREYDCLRA